MTVADHPAAPITAGVLALCEQADAVALYGEAVAVRDYCTAQLRGGQREQADVDLIATTLRRLIR